MNEKVIIIVGPTASGKSALGVQLAKEFGGEVISADSRQVYRGLDIGTGKVTKREMAGIPHHLLDIASPRSTISADAFTKRAEKVLSHIAAEKHVPIIVGGTGFYIDALTGRVTLPDVPPNPEYRKTLQHKTAEQLYTLLKKKDPKRAVIMDTSSERNNKLRLIRALEIALATTSPKGFSAPCACSKNPLETSRPSVRLCSEHAQGAVAKSNRPPRQYLWIGISPTLEELDKKIKVRLSARIKRGMIAEARRLHAAGLSYKRMETLGLEYRSLARLLQGAITRAEFEVELAAAIRRYARSQLRYWKRNKEIHWFQPSQVAEIEALVRIFLR